MAPVPPPSKPKPNRTAKPRAKSKDKTKSQPVGFHKIQKYTNLRLPDGTHKRKVDKIKSELIAKAKIKKAYRKLQEKEQKQKQVEGEQATSTQSILFGTSTAESGKNTLAEDEPGIEPASLELHPSRQERLEHDSEDEEAPSRSRKPRLRGPKRNKGYAVEQAKAEKIRREREEAVRKAKEAQKEKEKRERQRIRDKKLMTAKKADGRRKLGKQSIVLLERVKKQMAGAA